MTVTHAVVLVRVVNRLAGFGMSFLGLRLASGTDLSAPGVALVLALFGACTIPSRVLGGILALRVGARAAIGAGLSGAGCALLVLGLARATPLLVAAVLALGLAYELVEPATQAAVVDDPHGGPAAARFALLWSAVSVAGVLSGVLAAVLTRWGVTALFLVDGVSSLLAAVLAWRALPADVAVPHRDPTRPAALRDAITARLLTWTLAATPYAVLVMVVVLMLPLALTRDRQPAWVAGAALAISAASGLAAQRWMAGRGAGSRPRVDLAAGHVVFAAGVALWSLGHPAAYAVGAVLEGTAGTVLVGTYQAEAARRGRPGASAGTMAVFGLCWGAATVAAPLLATPVLERGPATLWLVVAAGSLVLTGGWSWPVRRPSRTTLDTRARSSIARVGP